MSKILGISAYYHDSAACLVVDGELVAAAQEERFSRRKHDDAFPSAAGRYCLREGDIDDARELDYVVFYDKPIVKFQRLLETYLHYAPAGLRSFMTSMPLWLRKKLKMRDLIRDELGFEGTVLFTEHHESHAASAFFPSPFERAAILTIDGVGERATASIGLGEGRSVRILKELHFPHSLGLLYTAFTYFTGFKVSSGEYKLMGLAPYGEPRYVETILDELVDLKDDGSLRLNMDYFGYATGLRMTNRRFAKLFGGGERTPEAALTQREMDLARSVQAVTEEAMLRMARHAYEVTGQKNLALAGGVALNCVGNGRILREGPFDKVWIQPAAGDAGGALGAALFVHHQLLGGERAAGETQKGSLLGPSYSDEEIATFLAGQGVAAEPKGAGALAGRVAELLDDGKVVGLFQGRMEFGPRALGSRSILGDPRDAEMQSTLNQKIKFRESFRPFAPAVLREDAADYFELEGESPYMLLTTSVAASKRLDVEGDAEGLAKLRQNRSTIPAVTHVDGSARVQTVGRDRHPDFYRVIEAFRERTGCPLVVNTSFNVRGEPIVCTPAEAWRCFRRTGMDAVVLGPYVVEKAALDAAPEPFWGDGDDAEPTADDAEEHRHARRFAAILVGVLAIVGTVSYTQGHPVRAVVLGGLAVLVATTALAARPLWTIVYRGWMKAATAIGRGISALALGVAFYAVLTPAGLLKRLFGERPLDTAWRDGRASFWIEKRPVEATVERYEKQH